jgi:ribosomal RNA-processing protein 9
MPDSFFATKTRKRKRESGSTSASAGPKMKASRTSKGVGSRSGARAVGKKAQGRARSADEELESEGSDAGGVDDLDLRVQEADPNESGEEDEDETPAEKRLRLARLYLESVKEGLGASRFCFIFALNSGGAVAADGEVDAAEIDRELISQRLQKDVLEHAGKMHLLVAGSVRAFTVCYLIVFCERLYSMTTICPRRLCGRAATASR